MPGFSRPSRILKRDFRRAADSESIRHGRHFIFQTGCLLCRHSPTLALPFFRVS